ncbi:hypothetical protein EVAR_73229_1, partial [Eumeta japonica]
MRGGAQRFTSPAVAVTETPPLRIACDWCNAQFRHSSDPSPPLPSLPISRDCAAFVTNFTAAMFGASYCAKCSDTPKIDNYVRSWLPEITTARDRLSGFRTTGAYAGKEKKKIPVRCQSLYTAIQAYIIVSINDNTVRGNLTSGVNIALYVLW